MIRVLVVEDSATARLLLTEMLNADPDIQVIGTANDGADGLARTLALRPDLITMDVQMPRMDGLEATRLIMEQAPTPIVVVSASADSADLPFTFNAIQAGALEVLEKPAGYGSPNYEALRERLVTTVKLMAEVKVVRRRARPPTGALVLGPARSVQRPYLGSVALLVVGASTGGPTALATVLKGLPGDFALPVLIVQHIAPGFLAGLVSWLQSSSALPLKVAAEGEAITPGQVYFAPEERHLVVATRGVLGCDWAGPVSHVRPSATVLFKSAARAYGGEVAGVLLTGMGDDGALGLKAIHDAGGPTAAQDEATSVVYGMPRVAAELGAVDYVLPLEKIAAMLVGLSRNAR